MNEIQNIINKPLKINEAPNIYDVAKAQYRGFLKQVEKSDLKNSYTRYLKEISLLKNVEEHAKKYAPEDVETIAAKIGETEKILKDRFGISR